jgi:hypothetical protein
MTSYRPQANGIAAAVLPGETIRWTGNAPQGWRVRVLDVVLIPFSLLWLGFATHWELIAVATGSPPYQILWGLLFVVIGVYLLVGRFAVDAYLRDRTSYAVTSVAAYVMREGAFPTVRRYASGALDATTVEMTSGDVGTIRFASDAGPFGSWYDGVWSAATLDAFVNVPAARGVYGMIEAARVAQPGHRAP